MKGNLNLCKFEIIFNYLHSTYCYSYDGKKQLIYLHKCFIRHFIEQYIYI